MTTTPIIQNDGRVIVGIRVRADVCRGDPGSDWSSERLPLE